MRYRHTTLEPFRFLTVLLYSTVTWSTIGMAMTTTTTTSSSKLSPSLYRLRGVFCGSGSDGMSDPRLAECILQMWTRRGEKTRDSSSSKEKPHVLYLGTATYDLPQFAQRQTASFQERGCPISCLNVVQHAPCFQELKNRMEQADIVVVGGGNTLFAMDRWNKVGLVPLLQAARDRGVILTGGSAGAICWFDGGHSDSMDPATYKTAMLQAHSQKQQQDQQQLQQDDESSTWKPGETVQPWKYICIPGLSFLPGVLCPHHDRVQSNGVLRAHDFDQMLLQQQAQQQNLSEGVLCLGLDHWAALVVESDDTYRVLSLSDKPGSVVYQPDGTACFSDEARGVPGLWIKTVVSSSTGPVVHARLCPSEGRLEDILKLATRLELDSPQVETCRRENPDNGPDPGK